MPTFEEIYRRIQRNKPPEGRRAMPRRLTWNRETASTMVSACHTYRISKRTMAEEGAPATINYFLELCATQTSAPRHVAGPFLTAKAAREAAQAHSQGQPLQADLA